MLEGLTQEALGTVINISIMLWTDWPVHNKLGSCSCPLSSHVPDKPKVQTDSIRASQIARLRNSLTNTPGLQMMLKRVSGPTVATCDILTLPAFTWPTWSRTSTSRLGSGSGSSVLATG